jgi:hypothetical protein
MDWITPRRLIAIYAVMVGAYLLGLGIIVYALAQTHPQRVVIVSALVALAIGVTISFGVKAAALMSGDEITGFRRIGTVLVYALPAIGLWAVAAWQLHG